MGADPAKKCDTVSPHKKHMFNLGKTVPAVFLEIGFSCFVYIFAYIFEFGDRITGRWNEDIQDKVPVALGQIFSTWQQPGDQTDGETGKQNNSCQPGDHIFHAKFTEVQYNAGQKRTDNALLQPVGLYIVSFPVKQMKQGGDHGNRNNEAQKNGRSYGNGDVTK